MALYLPIILMILATTVYHVAQKSVPSQVNPVFSLAMNYLVALLGTLLLSPIYAQRKADLWSWKNMNWAAVWLVFLSSESSWGCCLPTAQGGRSVSSRLSVILRARCYW